MPTPVENAVRTYLRAWSEPDSALRAELIESCFASDGRLIFPSRELRGRVALADEMSQLYADPAFAGLRITSPVETRQLTFRFVSAVDRRDGSSLEFLDAGMIDARGQIVLIMAFPGRLPVLAP